MSTSGTQFSKDRLEMLCDGIFAIAMTLLVLELKVPALPRDAPSADVWHALGEHGMAFFAFALTFLLTGQFWILHHISFHYLRHANRTLALLTIPFLMFVSLLPFSTSMLASFRLRHPVSLILYFGNQFMLASLLAIQWLVARRQGLLSGSDDDPDRRKFGLMIRAQPLSFAVALAFVFIAPRQAMLSLALTQAIIAVASRRAAKSMKAAPAPIAKAVPDELA